MNSTYRTIPIPGTILVVPSREQVELLSVGDLAPNCFGQMRRVTEIFGRGVDIKGKAYVCYYVEFGKDSTISGSLKEDEIVCHVPLCDVYDADKISSYQKLIRADISHFVTEDRTFTENQAIRDLR